MSEGCSGNCSSCGGGCTAPQEDKLPKVMAEIKHKVFVLSGKGGVGKSTVAASLAVSLAACGHKVGLLDVDFHGPSQPTLFNVQHERLTGSADGMFPLESAGVKLVSIGLLLDDEDRAVIWRGPAKMGVLKQLLEEPLWGALDYLIMDFPPGTGDEILSACQLTTGDKFAVVVTTPQELSLADCRKCIDFCAQVQVPVAGIVENMSGFVCPDCQSRHALFTSGGGAGLAERYNLPLLAELPVDPVFVSECSRSGIASALEVSDAVNCGINKITEAVINFSK